jgi:hypothetical protein
MMPFHAPHSLQEMWKCEEKACAMDFAESRHQNSKLSLKDWSQP